MCGICGIFEMGGSVVDSSALDRMTLAMRHRGPDGSGRYEDRELAMGHRRLSIIDLEGGAQPILNEDGQFVTVFNGEIYNFVELRTELEGLGHVFKTRTDTEVIVHAYEQWGESCVTRFNGMFAFALWDRCKRELLLARDHLGIKPLYYVRIGTSLLFASEIKALMQDSRCPAEVATDSLAELLTFRFVPSPKTLFKEIYKLPPGYLMKAGEAGVVIKRYWKWTPRERSKSSEGEIIEEYQALFEDAVRLQLRSDVPLGLFLSSGIDSGALLAVMSKYSSMPVRTFTIGFESGEGTNEVADARELARIFGAHHYSMTVGPSDYLQYFERYMQDLEEPVGHEPAAAFYFVARLASEHVKVSLCGQGADEPWAGYDRYKGIKLSSLYSRLPTSITEGIMPLVARFAGRAERFKRGVTALSEPDMLKRLTKVYSFFSAEMKSRLFKGELKAQLDEDPLWTRTALAHLQLDVKHLDPLSQMLYIDTRANLPDDLLMVGDKTSMANSVEVRVPFLDYRLVEFVESLPGRLKLHGLTGKYLHKKAMIKWLPRKVAYRRKKGFAHPIARWLRTSMKPLVEDCLLSGDSFLSRYFDQRYIATMLERDRAGQENYMRHIFLLLSLELWHRAFLIKDGSLPTRAEGQETHHP